MKQTIISACILVAIIGTAGSCKSSHSVEAEDAANKNIIVDQSSVSSQGKEPKDNISAENVDLDTYVKGTIVHSTAEGDCEYTIETEDGRMFDPINMDEKFRKAGTEILFRFGALRMANRCEKANPINIIDIRMK